MQPKPVESPLISHQQLLSARRVLYMTHLAIGDFTYQRVLLKHLSDTYPHLRVDVWIDDCRDKPKSWHQDRNQTLVQWLNSEPFIDTVYPIAKDKKARQDMVRAARAPDYDIVFFLAQRRTTRYAQLARAIAPKGIVVGGKAESQIRPSTWLAFKKLDGFFALEPMNEGALHISEVFTRRFQRCLPLSISQEAFDVGFRMRVPESYQDQALLWLKERFDSAADGKRVLINPVSTNEKRDYPPAQVAQMIELLHERDDQLKFVINLPPASKEGYLQRLRELADLNGIEIQTFCAQQHFYELPAMLSVCDVIITVETAIMHLSAALQKPQIVLMREQARQWQPYEACKVLYGNKRVDNIEVASVVDSFSALYPS